MRTLLPSLLICGALVILVLRSEPVNAGPVPDPATPIPVSMPGKLPGEMPPTSVPTPPQPDRSSRLALVREAPGQEPSSGRIDEGSAGPDGASEPQVRACRLTGHVLATATGKPVAGATVEIGDPLSGSDRRSTVTDEEGSYSFSMRRPESGLLELTCRAAGFAKKAVRYLSFSEESAMNQKQDLSLETSRIIAGRVIGPGGAGLPGVSVEAFGGRGGQEAISGTAGEFTIDGLETGTYCLVARAGDLLVELPEVEAGTTNCELRVESRGSISGRVVSAESGEPLRDFELVLRRAHPTNLAYGRPVSSRTFAGRADGSFRLEDVAEGSYALQVGAAGFANRVSGELRVHRGLETGGVVVALGSGATLRARVVDGCTGESVAGALLELRENHLGDEDFSASLGFATGLSRIALESDEQGRFEAELLAAGEYELRVSHPSFYPRTLTDLFLDQDLELDLGRIELHPGGTLTGTVTAVDGTRASMVDVFLRPVDGGCLKSTRVSTDESGHFTLDCAAGTYDICTVRPPSEPDFDGASATRVFVGEGELQRIALQLRSL